MNLSKWLDKKIPQGIANRRASYTLTHPWIIFTHVWLITKWGFQRLIRGWDDRAVWNTDTYLAEFLTNVIPYMKKNQAGIPLCILEENGIYPDEKGEYTNEQIDIGRESWFAVLDEISAGFEEYLENRTYSYTCDCKAGENKLEKSFTLLYKYFGNLWT